jgi:hypothetical protein
MTIATLTAAFTVFVFVRDAHIAKPRQLTHMQRILLDQNEAREFEARIAAGIDL